jgi:ketosteroid isomerase-like protein
MQRRAAYLFALAIALVSASACTSEEKVAPPPAPPVNWHSFDAQAEKVVQTTGPTAKEKAVAEAYLSAIATPGMVALKPLLQDDAHLSFPGRDDVRGREQVIRSHEVLFGAFDERKIATTRVFRTDSAQMLEWTMSGIQKREWLGLAPTNRQMAIQGITLLWTRDDGTITDVHVYFDVAVAKARLGVGPRELVALPSPKWPEGPAQVIEQASTPEEAANVKTVRAMLDALEDGSEQTFLAGIGDDIEIDADEHAQPEKGKEAQRTYFKTLRKSISQLDTQVEAIWGVGSFVVVEYFIKGLQLQAFQSIPFQRDRNIRMELVDVVDLKDGKMTRVWRYDNRDALVTPSP